VSLAAGLPEVCRLGLATRGNTHLKAEDVEWAVERGINYLNWCGHPDGLSCAIARIGGVRKRVVVAAQFEARSAGDAEREFASMLDELRTDYIDVLTLYYVESESEWEEIIAPDGAWHYLAEQKRRGRLKLIGLTSHQRLLAAGWAQSGKLDLLMIRYNAAHRGAEDDVFPVTQQERIPVVAFTGLRWKALLEQTQDDPAGFVPPSAVECYRFCLANAAVAVALAAPGNRSELEQDLALLDNWRAPDAQAIETLRAHGDRVRKHGGVFW
ncbi:MAG: putative oxidoreductase, aryl-alcohol dehydrogenase like protein, partial [Bryobacterales bacterium]|nr:putative oxidoreductase, aryl-alcohol dehydrogenase like protein [Bryobacterales bacterium]